MASLVSVSVGTGVIRVVGSGPGMTPVAASSSTELTTYRLPARSNAMSPFVPPPPGLSSGQVELATTPIGWFVVVFQPKMVIELLIEALARLAQ